MILKAAREIIAPAFPQPDVQRASGTIDECRWAIGGIFQPARGHLNVDVSARGLAARRVATGPSRSCLGYRWACGVRQCLCSAPALASRVDLSWQGSFQVAGMCRALAAPMQAFLSEATCVASDASTSRPFLIIICKFCRSYS